MRTRRTLYTTLLLLVVAAGALYGGGRQERSETGEEQDIDYLGVAGVMLRDGNYDRARNALNNVDPGADGVNTTRYYTLRGLLQLRTNEFEQAVETLERAQQSGETDPILNVYLAQAYYNTERYEQALSAIDAVENITRYPDLLELQAEAQWRLGRRDLAYNTLSEAIELFPDRNSFREQRIFYLIELNLSQAAAEQSLSYLSRLSENPDAYITIGEALRRGGQVDQAITTLEIALLQFPHNRRIHLALSQAYIDKGQLRSAGHLVEEAAANDFSLYKEAAEIYRRAGELRRALFLNSQIPDETTKTRQRFNLLLEMERYEEAVALEDRMDRLGLLQEDALRYAIAYAFFQNRQLDKATEYASQIGSDEYFNKATQLRRAIETVRADRVQYF
jgi:tetratricopeptide (TPR) repeat protein